MRSMLNYECDTVNVMIDAVPYERISFDDPNRTRELISWKSSGLSVNDLRRHSWKAWSQWYSTIANRQMCYFWKKQQEFLMIVLSRCRSVMSSLLIQLKIFPLLVFLFTIRDIILGLCLFSLQRTVFERRRRNVSCTHSTLMKDDSVHEGKQKTPAILNSSYQ